ncbi:MAG: glycosyltransferase [Anaerotruncus sp.]|nr:MAG: glycosyltransferase [Anaerotruncus sp.]
MNPKISVIVPVYMAEKYLDKCAESISRQSCRNIEVILVDDGSPDNCPALCDAWAKRDGRFRAVHQKNAGVSAARNTGMRLAKGDYIAFVDCDDWIDCDMLQVMLDAAVRENAEAVACDVFLESPGESLCCRGASAQSVDDPLKALLLDEIRPEVCAKLFSRSLLKGKLFDEKIKYAEDLLFLYYAFCDCKKAAYVSGVGYHYLQNSGNSSTTPYITVPRAKKAIKLRQKNRKQLQIAGRFP